MLSRFEQPVRCRDGHLFTNIWVPLGSLKAVRLGDPRFQRCPVGGHWTAVTRLAASAGEAEMEAAARVHELRVP